MAENTKLPLNWQIRKAFWNKLLTAKYTGNKPADIPLPEDGQDKIKLVALNSVYPEIDISNIKVADHIPDDEKSILKNTFVQGQVFLGKISSQMQSGLPEISADPQQSMDDAYTKAHLKLFPRPKLPAELKADDLTSTLATLATTGPFAAYLEEKSEHEFQWNLLDLNHFEHHDGLKKIGVKVSFKSSDGSASPSPFSIETDIGKYSEKSPEWNDAVKLALCAASNHTSLIRHFNHLHLACGAHIAIATRNQLNAKHPVKRLIWPSMYGSQYSNNIVMELQLGKDGDFVNMFSFTLSGIYSLYSKTYPEYNIVVLNPPRDAKRRGLDQVAFPTPTLDNLTALFNVIHDYTKKYIEHYFADDESVSSDAELMAWFKELESSIPNGITMITDGVITRASLAELCASFIYLGAVDHEILGTNLWNYQLWTHIIPTRCYQNGQREPVDVYQRLVNANFNLNVNRAKLIHDYTYLALDDKGIELFNDFQQSLKTLNTEMRASPTTFWKIYPDMLEANMNA